MRSLAGTVAPVSLQYVSVFVPILVHFPYLEIQIHAFKKKRVQLFMWLLLKKRIQCRMVLQKKHVLHNSTCEICNEKDETPEHIIISGCALGKPFWEKLSMGAMVGRDAC